MVYNKSKEDMILDVAKKVMEQKGFYNARMEDIAALAGIAKGTLYLYFKSKEELFLKLMDREYSKVIELLAGDVTESCTTARKIEAVVDKFLNYMEENRDFFLSIMYEAPSIKKKGIKKRMLEKAKLVQSVMRKIIEEGIKEGVLRNDVEIEVIVSSIVGTITRTIFYVIHFEKDRSLLTYKESILRVIFSGILKEDGGN